MTLRELFYKFAKDQRLPCMELQLEPSAPNQLCIYLNGANGRYEGHGLFLEEENLFVFYVPLSVMVPKEKRESFSAYLMDLNYGLKTANFYIEESTGALTARICQYMAGADWEKQELMERLITDCGRTADYYYPEIMKRLFG